MKRRNRVIAASLAAAALGAAAAVHAPPAQPPAGLYALFESLVVLRDGHGARHWPQESEPTRRDP